MRPNTIGSKLLEIGQREILTRRQALALFGGLAVAGGCGALAYINRVYLWSSIRLPLWLPTPFDTEPELRRARVVADAIRPLFRRKGRPAHNEWLDLFDEPGQTLNQYVRAFSAATREAKGSLLIQPIGELDRNQHQLLANAAALCEIFYGRPVRILPSDMPQLSDKEHNGAQLFTDPLLAWLKRRIPSDAAGLLGITAMDLTIPGWNFVFGIGSLTDRVGVWSMRRLASPKESREVHLRRIAQVAVHELGHMFGLWHCTAYACGMNGSNTLQESDAAPMAFCPECDAKVLWRLRLDPAPRYARLAQFAASLGITREADLWARCGQAVRTAQLAKS